MPMKPETVALVVEKMKGAKAAPLVPPEGGDEEGDVSAEPVTGEEAAASEAMAALNAGDSQGFARAVKTLVQLCMSQGYDEDEE